MQPHAAPARRFFLSRSGQLYTLEFGAALADTYWLPIGGTLNGDGSRLAFTNSPAGHDAGFYRVRVE